MNSDVQAGIGCLLGCLGISAVILAVAFAQRIAG